MDRFKGFTLLLELQWSAGKITSIVKKDQSLRAARFDVKHVGQFLSTKIFMPRLKGFGQNAVQLSARSIIFLMLSLIARKI